MLIFSTESLSVSTESVKVVGRKDVTPYFNKPFEIVFIASNVLSMTSAPKRPWMWVSTKPGAIYLPEKSITLSVTLGLSCWNSPNLPLIILR